MFFWLSKLLGPLVSPLTLVFAALALGIVFARTARARGTVAALAAACWLCSAELPVNACVVWWEGLYPAIALEDVPDAQAVVVLSGIASLPAHGNGRLEFGGGVDRVLGAAELLRAGKAPVLLVSGGASDPAIEVEPQATRLRTWLVDFLGLPADRVFVETRSRTTSENARLSAEVAREHGWDRVLLVTSAIHMPRAVGCFRKEGLEVIAYPVDHLGLAQDLSPSAWLPSARMLFVMRRLWREWAGWIAYRLAGRL